MFSTKDLIWALWFMSEEQTIKRLKYSCKNRSKLHPQSDYDSVDAIVAWATKQYEERE